MIAEAHLQSVCCDLVAEVARQHGKVQLRVAGASMVPALWPGDTVTIRQCDLAELNPNSIIVFRQSERLIVHRLVHRTGHQVVARGDARPFFDDPVDASEVIGQVESIERDGRAVSANFSFWKRMIAAILRRSERFTMLYLRVGSRIRRTSIPDAIAG